MRKAFSPGPASSTRRSFHRARFRGRAAATPVVAVLVALLAAAPGRAAESGKNASTGRDLSGVWQVKLTGNLTGASLLCQAVPPLNMSWRDTVLSARDLRELLHAVVPDSSRLWFDRVCAPRFTGDQVAATCRIPLTYAKPCILTANMTFQGTLAQGTQVTGRGTGDVALGGPGLCPAASCPGEIDFVVTRIAPVPAGARGANQKR
jgi:hypothetical protein